MKQGYELAEDEIHISLDKFRLDYTNADGSPKYALFPLPSTSISSLSKS